MRTLLPLTLLVTFPVAVAAPAGASQTYYCVEPVTVDVAAVDRDVTTPAICAYAPPAPTPGRTSDAATIP